MADLASIVRRNYEGLAEGNPTPMFESFAPNYRYTCHTRNRFDGRFDAQGLVQTLMLAAEVQKDLTLDIIDVRELPGDMVVLHYQASFEVDGKRVEKANCVSVVAFEDGKIVDAVDINSAGLNNFWRTLGDPVDDQYELA